MLNGGVGVVVGDVMGHGVGPALLMAETRAYLRALALTCSDVADILCRVNLALVGDTPDEHFVTLVFARLDPQRRTLSYASAGHITSYVLDRKGDVRAQLESTEMPMGISADDTFCSAAPPPTLQLSAGDLVFLLTDGIVEAARSVGDEPFGAERAIQVVHQNRDRSAVEIVRALYHAIEGFLDGKPQLDDITAVVVKVL